MAASSSSNPAKAPAAARPRSPKGAYTDPALREQLKAAIQAGDKGGDPGQWSARKSQLLANEYKKAGGGYQNEAPNAVQAHLTEWTEQEWQTSDGPPAKRAGGTTRYLAQRGLGRANPRAEKGHQRKKANRLPCRRATRREYRSG